MANSRTIFVEKEFTKFPGGRFREDGPGSGEEFREDHLIPALRACDTVIVNFDGVAGYAASFLEEAFGGAVVQLGLSAITSKLKIEVSDDPNLEIAIHTFMKRAAEAQP